MPKQIRKRKVKLLKDCTDAHSKAVLEMYYYIDCLLCDEPVDYHTAYLNCTKGTIVGSFTPPEEA